MSAELIHEPHPLTMTEAEFDRWCWTVDARVEFVDGKVIWMSPVSRPHYEVTQFLVVLLRLYLEQHPTGELCGPEFLIRLRSGLRRVPDLFYVTSRHEGQITRTYMTGAPDIAWEIVSADSVDRDWRDKFVEYQDAGISEYWIIDPAHCTAKLHRLRDGAYVEVESEEGMLRSEVLAGFWLRTEWLWARPFPKSIECLREMGVIP